MVIPACILRLRNAVSRLERCSNLLKFSRLIPTLDLAVSCTYSCPFNLELLKVLLSAREV